MIKGDADGNTQIYTRGSKREKEPETGKSV